LRIVSQTILLSCLVSLAFPGIGAAAPADRPEECAPTVHKKAAWTVTTGCVETPFDHSAPSGESFFSFYELSVPREESQGTIVVFHGGPAYPRKHLHDRGYLWRALRSHFVMLYFHQRGSGYSARVGSVEELKGREHLFSLDRIVEDTELLRKTLLEDKKIILMGKSAGGFVALKYALRFPDNVLSIILAATSAHHGYISRRTQVKRAFFEALNSRHPGFTENRRRANEVTDYGILKELDSLKELFVKGNILESVFFDLSYTLKGQFEVIAIARDLSERRYSLLVKRLAAGRKTLRTTGLESLAVLNNISCREFQFGKTNPSACEGKKRAEAYDVRKELKNLKMPVLVISGRYDPILPPRFQEEIVERLDTESSWHILEFAAHMVFQEQPNACAAYVLEFLGIRSQQPAQTPGL